jgi:hypothetical protein
MLKFYKSFDAKKSPANFRGAAQKDHLIMITQL